MALNLDGYKEKCKQLTADLGTETKARKTAEKANKVLTKESAKATKRAEKAEGKLAKIAVKNAPKPEAATGNE